MFFSPLAKGSPFQLSLLFSVARRPRVLSLPSWTFLLNNQYCKDIDDDVIIVFVVVDHVVVAVINLVFAQATYPDPKVVLELAKASNSWVKYLTL